MALHSTQSMPDRDDFTNVDTRTLSGNQDLLKFSHLIGNEGSHNRSRYTKLTEPD